jgi:hypothetical protein
MINGANKESSTELICCVYILVLYYYTKLVYIHSSFIICIILVARGQRTWGVDLLTCVVHTCST